MIGWMRTVLVVAIVLVCWKSTDAARVIDVSIVHEDARIQLSTSIMDGGFQDADTVWNYLKKLAFVEPSHGPLDAARHETGFLLPEKDLKDAHLQWVRLAVRVLPDEKNELQATLAGKIKIRIQYGGEVETKTLRLIRKDKKDDRWFIDPKQIDELRKVRKVKK